MIREFFRCRVIGSLSKKSAEVKERRKAISSGILKNVLGMFDTIHYGIDNTRAIKRHV